MLENAEDLDFVMPMYNLLRDSKSYSKTSGSLWNYYRDELSDETNCVITRLEKRLVTAAQGDNPEVPDDSPTGATLKIKDCKLLVPVVTLLAENDNKLLDQLKTGFKRTIKWNKYRSEMSNQAAETT